MNILIIEDDIYLAQKIKQVFKKKVITNIITILSTYEEFINELTIIDSYDIILTDIKLDDLNHKNWIDIIKILRNKKIITPIIIISWYNDIPLIETAFQVWANDYITKPFRLQELEIRIMRWFKSYCINIIFSNSDIITYKSLSYKFNTNNFYYKSIKIELTKKSKIILFQLLLKPETLLSDIYLKSKIWWDRDVFKERNIRVNILRLKVSLWKLGLENRLENIRGEWYMLKKNKS